MTPKGRVLSCRLPPALLEEVRGAVEALYAAGVPMTVTAFVAHALHAELAKARKRLGGDIPERSGTVRRGRPKKARAK